MLMDVLSLIGAAAVGTAIIALIVWIAGVATKIWRVAKHYHEVYDPDEYWSAKRNLFRKVKDDNTALFKRLYVAERDGRYAYSLAKQVAMERKQHEEEQAHDDSVRGTDCPY
jgi:hypothetical protein